MAKFFGLIGFAESQETSPGVWQNKMIERPYYGDIVRKAVRWQANDNLNDDVVFNNQISVIGDEYMFENFATMRYVVYGGARWTISSIEINRPRLIIGLGEVWNGDTPESSDDS